MQARPQKARDFGVAALETALEGVHGRTALHICFGYAAIIHARPEGYNFLPELAETSIREISIETAQSNLDCSILEKLEGKTIILGVLDLSDPGSRARRRWPRASAARSLMSRPRTSSSPPIAGSNTFPARLPSAR